MKKIYCTPTNSMIHKFLDAPQIMDYENTIYSIAPSQKFHLLGFLKNKHSKKFNFESLFYGQLR
jgi:hypothetical protein